MKIKINSGSLREVFMFGRNSGEMLSGGGGAVVRMRMRPSLGQCAVDTQSPEISTSSVLKAEFDEVTEDFEMLVCPTTMLPFIEVCGSEVLIEPRKDEGATFFSTKPGVNAKTRVPKIEANVTWNDLSEQSEAAQSFACRSEGLARAVEIAHVWTTKAFTNRYDMCLNIVCNGSAGGAEVWGVTSRGGIITGVSPISSESTFSATVFPGPILSVMKKIQSEKMAVVEVTGSAIVLRTSEFVASCALSTIKFPDFKALANQKLVELDVEYKIDRDALMEVVVAAYGVCGGESITPVEFKFDGINPVSVSISNNAGHTMQAMVPLASDSKAEHAITIHLAIGLLKERLRQLKEAQVVFKLKAGDPAHPISLSEGNDEFLLMPMTIGIPKQA